MNFYQKMRGFLGKSEIIFLGIQAEMRLKSADEIILPVLYCPHQQLFKS